MEKEYMPLSRVEQKYDFYKFLETVHQADLRDFSLSPETDECVISEEWTIRIPQDASPFLARTARDLAEYFAVSMNIDLRIARGNLMSVKSIVLDVDNLLPVKRSFRLSCVSDKIIVSGADERGTAMGVYHIEDIMSLREAPFVHYTVGIVKEPLFSPRMIHSGYGMDIFTEPYFRRIAHAGFDAILVYVKNDPEHGMHGPFDFNHLINQAEESGLDVYFYSSIKNTMHPDELGAQAFYEDKYGGLFKRYPKAKGLILVGESCQFPSRDPDTTMSITNGSEPCFRPSGKSAPGWWPCRDFPQFVDVIQNAVRKYAPHADIVFWTYNWAHAPEHLRTDLIENLPKNVTVELNFELHDNVRIWGTQERALDYTISLTGPSKLFQAEGAATKRAHLPLYAMSNTAGKTWDIGAVPYLPAPMQWGVRMENLIQAKAEYGLSGLMESHHYGWFPSIISELGQWMFWSNGPSRDEILKSIATRDFSAKNADTVLDVWRKWSRATAEFITPIEDQYGPCRVGPSYPFLFAGISLRQTFGMTPNFPWSDFNVYEIAFAQYQVVNDPNGLDIGPRRIQAEIRHLPEVIAAWSDGADRLECLLPALSERKQLKNLRLIGVARFIAKTLTTTLNLKKWWTANQQLLTETNPIKAETLLDDIVKIANDELANVRSTIPLVQADSSLGYEPSMDYVTDEEHLQWKIRQLSSVLELDIPKYREGIRIAAQMEKENAIR